MLDHWASGEPNNTQYNDQYEPTWTKIIFSSELRDSRLLSDTLSAAVWASELCHTGRRNKLLAHRNYNYMEENYMFVFISVPQPTAEWEEGTFDEEYRLLYGGAEYGLSKYGV